MSDIKYDDDAWTIRRRVLTRRSNFTCCCCCCSQYFVDWCALPLARHLVSSAILHRRSALASLQDLFIRIAGCIVFFRFDSGFHLTNFCSWIHPMAGSVFVWPFACDEAMKWRRCSLNQYREIYLQSNLCSSLVLCLRQEAKRMRRNQWQRVFSRNNRETGQKGWRNERMEENAWRNKSMKEKRI